MGTKPGFILDRMISLSLNKIEFEEILKKYNIYMSLKDKNYIHMNMKEFLFKLSSNLIEEETLDDMLNDMINGKMD
jgi:hypothetical protein